jgi:hypothetical protein
MAFYSASILFGYEEARMWARLASPQVRRNYDRVQTKCQPCISLALRLRCHSHYTLLITVLMIKL